MRPYAYLVENFKICAVVLFKQLVFLSLSVMCFVMAPTANVRRRILLWKTIIFTLKIGSEEIHDQLTLYSNEYENT